MYANDGERYYTQRIDITKKIKSFARKCLARYA